MAKGIGSGYLPLGAMIVSELIAAPLRERYFAGGLTSSGNPLACAAGVATVEAIREEGLVERAAELGTVLGAELAKLAERHPSIGCRGRGCGRLRG